MRVHHDHVSIFLAGLLAIVWSLVLTYKYTHFGFYDWDMTLCAHALWNFANGHWYSSIYGANPFVDHGYYIALLLVPFYKIFSSPIFLLFLKSFSFGAGSFLIYRIAVTKLPSWAALIIQVMFLIFPANIYMMFFEFNFENIAVFLIPLMLYALLEDKKKIFIFSVLTLCLVKENMPLVVIMTGGMSLLLKKDKKFFWVAFPVITGCLVFILGVFVITPFLRAHLPGGAANLYLAMYKHVALHPVGILPKVFSLENLSYLRDLLGVQAVFAFFSPQILLGALPLLLQAMLSVAPTMHTIYFHYSASLAPFIFTATVFTLAAFKARWSQRFFTSIFIIFVFGSVVHTTAFVADWNKRVQAWNNPANEYRQVMVSEVPQTSSVVATFDLLSHMTDRPKVYALYNVWKDLNLLTGETPYLRPREADTALVDMMDPWLIADLVNDPLHTSDHLRSYFTSKTWRAVTMNNNLATLTSYPGTKGEPPVFIQRAPFKETVIGHLQQSGLDLEDVDISALVPGQFGQMNMPVTFYWSVFKRPMKPYFVDIKILRGNTVLVSRRRLLGLITCPAPAWLSGEYVKEEVVHSFQRLPSDNYVYAITVTDVYSGRELTWGHGMKSLNINFKVD